MTAVEGVVQRLDAWAVDYLDAAVELRQIVRQLVLVDKAAGWRVVGKAIGNLEVPDQRTDRATSGGAMPR